ncbi:MAG: CHASE domain-containing protein [Hyphomicrobiaceae bacterium]
MRRALAIFLAACAIAAVAAWDAHEAHRASAKVAFDSIADKVTTSIDENMVAYQQVLRGGVALFDALGDVSRKQWKAYVESLNLSQNYSGIQGVGYAAVVEPQKLPEFEQRVRSEGISDFKVHPVGARELNTAILYLEPLDWRNRRALGFDMYSEDVRREAMKRAWKTGTPSLSHRVILLQETGNDVQNGVLLYLPVFREETAAAEVGTTLKGFVYSPFRMRDLMSGVLARTDSYSPNFVRVEIFDEANAKPRVLLFDSAGVSEPAARVAAAAYVAERKIVLNGTTWYIKLTSLPEFDRHAGMGAPLTIALVGILLGALTAALFGFVYIGKETAHFVADQLAVEVETRKRAEEQTRVALRELAHRVKNTLTIVTAIASQTVRHSEDLQEFDGKFRTRLLGLSRVHDLLASGRSYSTDLAALAEEVLKPYKRDEDGSLKVEGAATVLAPNAAIMLSMLFNELATNATKYGAWANKSGKVSLSWQLTKSNGEDSLDIRWQELGGPMVEPPSRKGFGTNVIKFSIERSLRGRADAVYAPEGVTYNISIPWSSVASDQNAT